MRRQNSEQQIHLESIETASILFGPRDVHLKRLRQVFSVRLAARGSKLRIQGPEQNVRMATECLDELVEAVRKTGELNVDDLDHLVHQTQSRFKKGTGPAETALRDTRRVAEPKTRGQERYLEALSKNDVVLCLGPAGTGKTFLAVSAAVQALKQGLVQKVVLTRPAVEAGERLGFLPGDLRAKVNPYLRPLYDALYDFLDIPRVQRMLENDIIEIVPLAYMRGRTLSRSYVILDEAQNCTAGQLKMFLTRLGNDSRMAITGDPSQNDLDHKNPSGLAKVARQVEGIPGLAVAHLSRQDIVRHPLVQRILERLEPAPSKTDTGSEEKS